MEIDFFAAAFPVALLAIFHQAVVLKAIIHLKKNHAEKFKELTTKYAEIPIIKYRLRLYNGQYLALFTNQLALDDKMKRYILLYKASLLLALIYAVSLIAILAFL